MLDIPGFSFYSMWSHDAVVFIRIRSVGWKRTLTYNNSVGIQFAMDGNLAKNEHILYLFILSGTSGRPFGWRTIGWPSKHLKCCAVVLDYPLRQMCLAVVPPSRSSASPLRSTNWLRAPSRGWSTKRLVSARPPFTCVFTPCVMPSEQWWCERFVNLPGVDGTQEILLRNSLAHLVPQVHGVIDCTHIPIRPPNHITWLKTDSQFQNLFRK